MINDIFLYNSLTSSKERFIPINDGHVMMYVCGPTVYDVPHIGNLRSVIVYDVLYRILSAHYQSVTYVRNITDVDDKIIASAHYKKTSTSYIAGYYTKIFCDNVSALGCIRPTFEPKATENINEMIAMISKLIENGNAYTTKDGNVYFDVSSYKDYAKLSGRNLDDLISGNRISVEKDKKNVHDFALWKSSNDEFFVSPWGKGRPGWHIECSAMSTKYLGKNFDIHGGGLDLKFPHHENEIAQSCCANLGSYYAKYWIHNGFLTVNGEKMSKSVGNVLYLETLTTKGLSPDLVRYVLLSTHYRKPLDWTDSLVLSAKASIQNIKKPLKFYKINVQDHSINSEVKILYSEFLDIMCNDINTPLAFCFLHELASDVDYSENNSKKNIILANTIFQCLTLLGFKCDIIKLSEETLKHINLLISNREFAKRQKNFAYADEIRKELLLINIELHDNKDGTTTWEYKS